jgi:hypothetical protein
VKLGPFNAGDPIPREAAYYTACGDAARAHMAGRTRLSGRSPFDTMPPGVVLVKNHTAAALDRGAIVGIGEAVITPDQDEVLFREAAVFYAETPTVPAYLEKWGVLTEPLASGSVGRAVISGVYAVEVDFAYSDEPYVDVKTSTTANLQGAEGGCRVLWKETGTGVLWAVVQLGRYHYPILRGKLDGDLTKATGYATMSVWEGSTLADSGRNVTVYDPGALSSGKKIASGSGLSASWTSGKWWLLTPYVCES